MDLTQKRIVLLAVAVLFFVAMPLFGSMTGDVWIALSSLGKCKGGGCTFARVFMDGTFLGWGIFLAFAGAPPGAVLIVTAWAA